MYVCVCVPGRGARGVPSHLTTTHKKYKDEESLARVSHLLSWILAHPAAKKKKERKKKKEEKVQRRKGEKKEEEKRKQSEATRELLKLTVSEDSECLSVTAKPFNRLVCKTMFARASGGTCTLRAAAGRAGALLPLFCVVNSFKLFNFPTTTVDHK